MPEGKKIVGLVGEKLAGKDTVANFLVEKYQARHIRFSHILDDILEILDLPITRENEVKIGNGIRSEFEEGVFIPAVLKRLKNYDGLSVINGIRLAEEFEAVKNLGATMIYITAPAAIRFERYRKRQEKADDGLWGFEKFVEAESGHTERFISMLGEKSDVQIDNRGNIEQLYAKIQHIMDSKFA